MPEDRQGIADAESAPLSGQLKNGKLVESAPVEPKNDVNSTDIDPCLNHKESRPNKLPFCEKYITNFEKRTGLSRKWALRVVALSVLIFILFLVVLGLAVGWPTIPHMLRFPICRDPKCLRAAAQVQENLDSSVSPCTDLWSSLCSKYSKNSSGPLDRPVWNNKEMLVQKESERIRNLISTLEPPLHIGTVEWKLKHFYEACMDVNSITLEAARPLTKIISELGGWYILRDWNQVDFDGMQLLKNLQVRYGVSPFFRIHVEPDPHVPDTHSIRISPSGLGLPDKDYYFRDDDHSIRVAYKDYIRDIVISLGSTKGEATKFGTDMFNFEQRLAEITPDSIKLRNPITTYNAVSLEELKLTASMMPFHEILQEMYLEVTVSDSTEVIVTSLEYLSEVAHIISTTDRQIMNSYLIWCLVREYIPYLSESYMSAQDLFNGELFGISKPQKRWEICTRLVKKYMSLAAEYYMVNLYPIQDESRKILNQTFGSILRVVKDKVSAFGGSPLLVQHLESKINALSLHVGLPETTRSYEFLKEYYHSLIVLKLNLFENMKNAIAFQKRIEQRMLLNTLPEGVFLRVVLSQRPEVGYVPSKNAVVIPRSVIDDPLYEDVYFRPVVYGRLGSEIALAILSSVLPYGSLWTSDKKILSQFHMTVNESLKSVQTTVVCLSRHMSDLKLDVPTSRAIETALTVLVELSAARIAYQALEAESSADSHRHYGGLEQYEESALYFISFAQTKCSYSTRRYEIYDNTLHFKLPSKSVLDIAWEQLPDFRKSLDCAPSKSRTCNEVF